MNNDDDIKNGPKGIIVFSFNFFLFNTLINKIYKLINKEYKGVKLRKFLKKIWLVEIRKNKEFTPNSFYVQREKYINQCTQYVRGN